MKLPNKPSVMRLLPLLLVVSLTACASNSPKPVCECPAVPAPPSATTPQPSVGYSISVSQALKEWRAKLTATPLMPER